MRLKDCLKLLDLILSFDNLSIESPLLETRLNDTSVIVLKLCRCPKNVVFYNIHQTVELIQVVLNWCPSQYHFLLLYIDVLDPLSYSSVEILCLMSFIHYQEINLPMLSKGVDMSEDHA